LVYATFWLLMLSLGGDAVVISMNR
jgi:hypothetical protein